MQPRRSKAPRTKPVHFPHCPKPQESRKGSIITCNSGHHPDHGPGQCAVWRAGNNRSLTCDGWFRLEFDGHGSGLAATCDGLRHPAHVRQLGQVSDHPCWFRDCCSFWWGLAEKPSFFSGFKSTTLLHTAKGDDCDSRNDARIFSFEF